MYLHTKNELPRSQVRTLETDRHTDATKRISTAAVAGGMCALQMYRVDPTKYIIWFVGQAELDHQYNDY